MSTCFYLAAFLLEKQWSLKSLHREIVLSSTYQQISSELDVASSVPDQLLTSHSTRSAGPVPTAVDPENRLYWRMNRQRLEFEPLRDSILAVAERLDETMGGRAVNLTVPPFAPRRAVYGFIDRQDLPNLFRAFDFASPDQSQAERPRTTVPQQALFLMNSPFVIEQAKALAGRNEVANSADRSAKTQALYRILFQRDPSAEESQVADQFITASEQESPNESFTPWQRYAQLLLMSNEFAFFD